MARCVAALIAIGSDAALTALGEYATAPIYEDPKASALRQAIAKGLFAFDPTYYCQRVNGVCRKSKVCSGPFSKT